MHFFDNYDILIYMITFLPTKSLREVAATCSLLFELSTSQLVRHVRLDSLKQTNSFAQFMLRVPARITLMRSLATSYGTFPRNVPAHDYVGPGFRGRRFFDDDFVESVIRTLASVIQKADNLVSLDMYREPGLVLTSLANGTRITELTLNGVDLGSTDLRELFQQIRGSLRRLVLIETRVMDVGYVLEPLQSILELLRLRSGRYYEFPIQHGRQWPGVRELTLSAPLRNKQQLLYAFPNLRRLVIYGVNYGESVHPLDVCRTAWTHLSSLRGDLDLILSLGLRGHVAEIELSYRLSNAFLDSGAGTDMFLDFLKRASPRYLSLRFKKDKIATISLDARLSSVVPSLQYLVIDVKFTRLKFESEILPRIVEALKNSKIVYFFVQVPLSDRLSRTRSEHWLPLLANSVPSLQYVGLGYWSAGEKIIKWYRVRVSGRQAGESDGTGEIDEQDTVRGVVLEDIDSDVGELLKHQCLSAV